MARFPVTRGLAIHSKITNNDEKSTANSENNEKASDIISDKHATVRLEPVPSRNSLLVKIETPREPSVKIPHVPCDIVLVIDVSGSMGSPAPVPGEEAESAGLSVLDLTKHAARTIIETMDQNDRLSIITFASKAKVLQPLLPMTQENKLRAVENVKRMKPLDATNLWQGMLESIKQFKTDESSSNVPAIMILTDGMPNHMNPAAGFVPKIRGMSPLPASIHTFGFGYSLRSGLLKSIAEIGGGNYAFIPDAGMIGTVFVHAVANLQNTFATRAVLKLTYSKPLEVYETTGASVEQKPVEFADDSEDSLAELTLTLGNLQFGQSRDLFLGLNNAKEIVTLSQRDPTRSFVQAYLTYVKPGNCLKSRKVLEATMSKDATFIPMATAQRSVLDFSDVPASEVAYHESRSLICNFISSMFIIQRDGERSVAPDMKHKHDELKTLVEKLPAKDFEDEKNKSLMLDVAVEEPKGQVSMAIENKEYFRRWGCHFLPSLLNAHTRQVCNSFKDPGPLQYGTDSPLFISCRDSLDQIFDNLPVPEPSCVPVASVGGGYRPTSSLPVSMSAYRNSSGVCFAASTEVTLASGRVVQMRKLRRGMKVRTPSGSRRVAIVLKTPVEQEVLCRVGDILVTPWHPISLDGKRWDFPANAATAIVMYTGCIYSILLERDANVAAHAIRVGDMWGVTLGHGLTSGNDVRAHSFFGDYNSVGKSLLGLNRRSNGVVIGNGVERNEGGRVMGFQAYGGWRL
ncbi:inter-alpha-trypsin inhibitor heavy chain h3 [Fusarium longipes]|uniref:Inter-alpha-trypsin inhibitor heavy chain h3 n=1 Tax=Fusarium longipes TaxID=694270 RepID=A0A395RVM5_9HYPO|nr:inter-alpha-trypsin inhibitor heavy chain h3 [Fusarium longipes]